MGHGGLPGYFWWRLMFSCVRIYPATHICVCGPASVCVCVGGQSLTGAVLNTDNRVDVLQLRWCRQKVLSSPWQNRVPDLPRCVCLVPEKETALVISAL